VKKQNFSLLFLLVLVSLPSLVISGDWISSGGDGVACFENEEIAQLVSSRIKKEKEFPNDYLNKIIKITSLERFEAEAPITFQKALQNNDFSNLVKEKKEILKFYSPLFYQYFEIFEQRSSFNHWSALENVKEVDDSIDQTDVTQQDSKCVLVQVIHRKTISMKGSLPQLKLEYHQRLWEKLPTTDQVILYFHETFYAMGFEVGHYGDRRHSSSQDIRDLSRGLLSDVLLPSPEEWSFDARAVRGGILNNSTYIHILEKSNLLRLRINTLFGDYVLLFSTKAQEYIAKEKLLFKYTEQGSRYLHFIDFVEETRSFIKFYRDFQRSELKKAGQYDISLEQQLSEKARAVAMDPERIVMYLNSINDESPQKVKEIAFIFMGYWVFSITNNEINGEKLLSWHQDGDESPFELEYTCQRIQKIRIDPTATASLQILNFAKEYCADLKLNASGKSIKTKY